ncbi:hypothetical protein Kfla_6974 [Kribbella flavida DSM 17836]|uniref:Uncharacterized protein n=1 Tax=Kribbella flavida (strain DSM 17836 / JCM 10339 / NBRC 14399) TaxID=479435 RepID=D2Q3U0_KRIFD|nr:hypothetical protein [Kribbella flavida]ADB35962.1 hypothetical protein Kfla_6974 [Kribbella flavida DSM 17836]
MKLRTLTAAVATLGLAAVTPLAASAAGPAPDPSWAPPTKAAEADIDGTCHLWVPTRVAIDRPYRTLFGSVSGRCKSPESASGWVLRHPSLGGVNQIVFDVNYPTGDGRWRVPDTHAIGYQVFRGLGSYNEDQEEDSVNVQNQVGVTVKLAARAWIASSRTGDVVTLKGTSLLYSTSANTYFKRSAPGAFQFRERGSTVWRTLKAGVRTNGKGEVQLSYRYSKLRDYRFVLYSTPISWDAGSAVTIR